MELFRLLGRIAIENSDANSAIDDTTGKAEKSEGRMSNAFGKIGGAAKALGKAMIAGLAVGATAIIGLTKKAVDAYAEYEQLVGGVETLFKDSSSLVVQYAKNAYKTAGMSANEYMATVTSFSASLLQSLGGDTEEAAKKADRAITDMADNANKMGTSMESIQNAYQGFAKQNYTMLDNLKLGYGGTKTEMARLIADAAKMKDIQEELGVTIDASSMSYANIVDAISVVQKSMGIMGATQEEASKTIQGSISAMKGAWQNFITGLGDEDADLSTLTSQLTESVVTVGKNMLPRIGKIVGSIIGVVKEEAPEIIKQIPSVIAEHLPAVAEKIVEGFKEVFGLQDVEFLNVSAMFENLSAMWEKYGKPTIESVKTSWNEMSTALSDLYVQYIEPTLGTFVDMISELFTENEDKIAKFAELIQTIFQWFNEVVIQGIFVPAMQFISTFVSENMDTIKAIFQTAFDFIGGIIDFFIALFKGDWKGMWESLKATLKAGFDSWKHTFELIKAFFGKIMVKIKKPIVDAFENIRSNVTEKLNLVKSKVTSIFENIRKTISDKINSAKDTVKSVIDKIKGFFDFEFKMPELKTPHFSVKPEGWKIGDLLEGKIPELGIEWYKKGGVLTQPTVFGMNGNNAMVGGEAGAEAIAPIDVLMGYVRTAVAEQNQGMYMAFNRMVELLENYMPEIAANSHKQIVMNNGVLVGELAPGIDRELGGIASWKGRGNR